MIICFEIGSCSVAQTGLEQIRLLPLSPQSWSYRGMPLCKTLRMIQSRTNVFFLLFWGRVSLDVVVWVSRPHRLVFECLVPSFWSCLGRMRRSGDLVGGDVSLGVAFGVSEAHAIPSVSFFTSCLRIRCKLWAPAPGPYLPACYHPSHPPYC